MKPEPVINWPWKELAQRFELPQPKPQKVEEANKKRSGSVQIRINRFDNDGNEWADIPIEYHNGDAWFCEDVGPFKQGESVELSFEEQMEIYDELRG